MFTYTVKMNVGTLFDFQYCNNFMIHVYQSFLVKVSFACANILRIILKNIFKLWIYFADIQYILRNESRRNIGKPRY